MNMKLLQDISSFLEGDICARQINKRYQLKLEHTRMLEFERMYHIDGLDKKAVTEDILSYIRSIIK